VLLQKVCSPDSSFKLKRSSLVEKGVSIIYLADFAYVAQCKQLCICGGDDYQYLA